MGVRYAVRRGEAELGAEEQLVQKPCGSRDPQEARTVRTGKVGRKGE